MKCFEKPMSSDEEKLVLEAYHAGDMRARDVLIEKNMRLVAHMIKKYSCSQRDNDDLISVGTIGLIKAISSFDSDKGIRLATYAAKCIDNELLMMLRAEKKKYREVSIYEPIGTDKEGNEISIIDVICVEDDDVVEGCMHNQRVEYIKENIKDILTEREYEIIKERYDLDGKGEKTQSEISVKLGISRSYVSRIEKKALLKLRKKILEKGL